MLHVPKREENCSRLLIKRRKNHRCDRSETARRAAVIEPLEPRLLLTTLPAGFTENLISSNLGEVTNMDVLPDGRVLVTDQTGNLNLVPAQGGSPTTALTLTVDDQAERGLLGVTHDPHFSTNHFIYLYHTVPATGTAAPFNEVTRYTLIGNTASPASAVDILKLNDLNATAHNGGSLHFGPDGKLYISVGENVNSANSQTLGNLLGKILRIDVSKIVPGDPVNDVAKLIPKDNPFVKKAVGINKAIYALGVRNPFTFAVNANGTIYINDVGQGTWEEIDLLKPGANFGWGLSEGFNGRAPTGLGPGKYFEPILAYNHSGGPAGGGIAIIGGVLYQPPHGASDPFPSSFDGKYFYADLGHAWMRIFNPSKKGSKSNPDTSSGFATGIADQTVAMAIAPDGGIYYASRSGDGQLFKISAVIPPPAIKHQPSAISVKAGNNAQFTVSVTGKSPITYQWQRDTGNGFNNIAGATSKSFTLPHAQLADATSKFRVLITNAGGTTTSAAATLAVTAVQHHSRR